MNEYQKNILQAILEGKSIQYHVLKNSDLSPSLALQVLATDIADLSERLIVKPDTVTCNGVEVPAPYRGEMKLSQTYFVPSAVAPNFAYCLRWANDSSDQRSMKLGIVYLNEEDAIARCKAMLITQ